MSLFNQEEMNRIVSEVTRSGIFNTESNTVSSVDKNDVERFTIHFFNLATGSNDIFADGKDVSALALQVSANDTDSNPVIYDGGEEPISFMSDLSKLYSKIEYSHKMGNGIFVYRVMSDELPVENHYYEENITPEFDGSAFHSNTFSILHCFPIEKVELDEEKHNFIESLLTDEEYTPVIFKQENIVDISDPDTREKYREMIKGPVLYFAPLVPKDDGVYVHPLEDGEHDEMLVVVQCDFEDPDTGEVGMFGNFTVAVDGHEDEGVHIYDYGMFLNGTTRVFGVTSEFPASIKLNVAFLEHRTAVNTGWDDLYFSTIPPWDATPKRWNFPPRSKMMDDYGFVVKVANPRIKSDGASKAGILLVPPFINDRFNEKMEFVFRSADPDKELVGEYSDIFETGPGLIPAGPGLIPAGPGYVNMFGYVGMSSVEGVDEIQIGVYDRIANVYSWNRDIIKLTYTNDEEEALDVVETLALCNPESIFYISDAKGNPIEDHEIEIDYNNPTDKYVACVLTRYDDRSKPLKVKSVKIDQEGRHPFHGLNLWNRAEITPVDSDDESILIWKINPIGLGDRSLTLDIGALYHTAFRDVLLTIDGEVADNYDVNMALDRGVMGISPDFEETNDFVELSVSVREANGERLPVEDITSLYVRDDNYAGVITLYDTVGGPGFYLVGLKIKDLGKATCSLELSHPTISDDPFTIEGKFSVTGIEDGTPVTHSPPLAEDGVKLTSSKLEVETGFHDRATVTVKMTMDDGFPVPYYPGIELRTNDKDPKAYAQYVSHDDDLGEIVFEVFSAREGEATFGIYIGDEKVGEEELTFKFLPSRLPVPECVPVEHNVKIIDKTLSTIKVLPPKNPGKIYHDDVYYLLSRAPLMSGGGWEPFSMRSLEPVPLMGSMLNGSDLIEFEIELYEEGTGEPLTGQKLSLLTKDNRSIPGFMKESVEVSPGVYQIAVLSSDLTESDIEVPTTVYLNSVEDVTFTNGYSKGEDSVRVYFVPELVIPKYLTSKDTQAILTDDYNENGVIYASEGNVPFLTTDGYGRINLSVYTFRDGVTYVPTGEDFVDDFGNLIPRVDKMESHELALLLSDPKLTIVEGDEDGLSFIKTPSYDTGCYNFLIHGHKPGTYKVAFSQGNKISKVEPFTIRVFETLEEAVEDANSQGAEIDEKQIHYVRMSKTLAHRSTVFTSSEILYRYTPLEADTGSEEGGYLDIRIIPMNDPSSFINDPDLYIRIGEVNHPRGSTVDIDPCDDCEYLGMVEDGVYRYRFRSDIPRYIPVKLDRGPIDRKDRNETPPYQYGYTFIAFKEPEVVLSYEIDGERSTIESDRVEIYADGLDTAIVSVTLFYKRNNEEEPLRLATGVENVILHSLNGDIIGKQEYLGEVEEGVYQFRLRSEDIGKERLTFIATNPQ